MDLCISNKKNIFLTWYIFILVLLSTGALLVFFSFTDVAVQRFASIVINFNSCIYCCTFLAWFRCYFNVSSRLIFARSILTWWKVIVHFTALFSISWTKTFLAVLRCANRKYSSILDDTSDRLITNSSAWRWTVMVISRKLSILSNIGGSEAR